MRYPLLCGQVFVFSEDGEKRREGVGCRYDEGPQLVDLGKVLVVGRECHWHAISGSLEVSTLAWTLIIPSSEEPTVSLGARRTTNNSW